MTIPASQVSQIVLLLPSVCSSWMKSWTIEWGYNKYFIWIFKELVLLKTIKQIVYSTCTANFWNEMSDYDWVFNSQVQGWKFRRQLNVMSMYYNKFGNSPLSAYDLPRHNFLTRIIVPKKIFSWVLGIKPIQRTIVWHVSAVLLL